MNKERNALKAGFFIVISTVLVLGIIARTHRAGLGPTLDRTVTFKLADDIGGLRVGDDVRVGGFRVGAIRGIQVIDVDTPDPKLLVDFSVPASYTLHEDAKVSVQSALTGAANLNIEQLGAAKVLPEGEPLVGRPDPRGSILATLGRASSHISELVDRVTSETVPKVNAAVDAFHETAANSTTLVKHVDAKVDPVVGKYNNVTDHTSEMMVQIRDVIGDSKRDFRGTVAHLNEVTGAIRDKVPPLLEHLDNILSNARAALEDARTTAANARDVTGSIRSVVTVNKAKLDGIITGLKTTSDNLKGASVEIRRSPWRLLYKPGPGEMANLNLYDSAREFAEGAATLSDAANALRDTLHDPAADKNQVKKLMDHLDESFANFKQVETKLWADVKE